MNDLKIFENKEFGSVRVIEIDGKPFFCGSDVAKSLGYAIPSKAVNTHCKGVSKMEVPTNGGVQQMLFIPEGDLYRLIAKSDLPSAENFESWVFDEILPSIRKYGAYMTPEKIEEVLFNPDTIIYLATQLKDEQEARKQLELKAMKDLPKVIFADSVTASNGTILIREMAKILKQNGVNTGEKRFYAWLREKGYLIKKKGTDYNKPTQRSMELGLFEIKETAVTHSSGLVIINITPKITGKGQIYFINKLKPKFELVAE